MTSQPVTTLYQWSHPHLIGYLGQIFLNGTGETAQEQLNQRYAHGGGFHPFEGFILAGADETDAATITYPKDPPMREVSRLSLNEQTLILFEHQWLAIVEADNSYRVTRVD